MGCSIATSCHAYSAIINSLFQPFFILCYKVDCFTFYIPLFYIELIFQRLCSATFDYDKLLNIWEKFSAASYAYVMRCGGIPWNYNCCRTDLSENEFVCMRYLKVKFLKWKMEVWIRSLKCWLNFVSLKNYFVSMRTSKKIGARKLDRSMWWGGWNIRDNEVFK